MKYAIILFASISLFVSCRKVTTPQSERPTVNLEPKQSRYKNLPPNVTSMEWEYNGGVFILKGISQRRGLLSVLNEKDIRKIEPDDVKIFRYDVLTKSATIAFAGYVIVPLTMRSFYYKPNIIPHTSERIDKARFNVNIPLDTSGNAAKIVFIETTVKDGKLFDTRDSSSNKNAIKQEITLNPHKK